ncbi:hypothetical protein Cyrtocomes_00664 [Candidatus Cyrtobacter comes]|uniref:Uncharacterized protein n=1 Tax=Candidatus Cyrtobacter comes TaxID=675776 RepID=A0ABU5L834_9RICK|nr:hypothetical protein [Candidatus Cyrtobacter comes]MDZ5762285.1 hypothetical protein [Candidatus Cyrtobacter comes]
MYLKVLIVMLLVSISARAIDKHCDSFINNRLEDLKPHIGYIAGKMSINKEYDPNKDPSVLSSNYTTQDKTYLTLCSILSSGDKERLSKYLAHNNFDKNCYDNLYMYCDTSLEKKIRTPADIDLKWSAYAATGDVKYVELLIDNLNEWLMQSQILTSDLQYGTIVMHHYDYKSSNAITMMKAAIKKYSQEDKVRFFMSQMALWSLGSISKNDSKVHAAAFLHAQKKEYADLVALLQTAYFSSLCQPPIGMSTSKSLMVLPGEKHKFKKINGDNFLNQF